MKIDSVEAFPLKIKAREKLHGGTINYSHFQTVLVKVQVDGVEGWGEAMTRADPAVTALLVKHLGRMIINGEFRSVEAAWKKPWRELRVRGHTRGVEVEALSGIEIALFDAFGKLRKTPVCKLFSKSPAADVPAFAGSLFSSRGPLEEQVEFVKVRELTGAKIKIGFGVAQDLRTLRTVRRQWSEGMLVADANGAYDAAGAKRACSAFSELALAWFEEPVLSDDMEGYASLARSKVKIGAGESWFPDDFQRPIEEGLIDVVEPSVSRCGGIAVEVTVAKRAKARGLTFSPMTGMNSVVSLSASLHVAAAMGTIGVEYNPFPNPLQTDLASGIGEPRRGKIKVPTHPGLGIEIDQSFVNANSP